MNRLRWNPSTIVGVTFLFAGLAQGGELRVKITDLKERPRAGLEFTYSIRALRPSNEEIVPVVRSVPALTSPDNSSAPGTFSIDLPDVRASVGSAELFVTLSADGFADVRLESILGSDNHDVTVVMRKTGYPTSLGEGLLATYWGRRGNFHLLGSSGTGLHVQDGRFVLSSLKLVSSDERYCVYREETATGAQRDWAFARAPVYTCRCDGRSSVQRYKGFAVWVRDSSSPNNRWRLFQWASRIIPADSNSRAAF